MDKILVTLKNCYGITNFEHEFDFTHSQSVKACMLYAPNGSMKSSFARTMQDLSKGQNPKDVVYPDRKTSWELKDSVTKADIPSNAIYVVKSQVTGDDSEKISLLLAKEELRNQYDKIYADIRSKKEELIKSLSALSGLKNDTEKNLTEGYNGDSVNALFSMREEVNNYSDEGLSKIQYVDVINSQTKVVLEDADFLKNINDYTNTYEELLSKSNLFKKGGFDHNNADAVSKDLAKHKFFDAGHKISLNTLAGIVEVSTPEQLNDEIIKEKDAILQDETLRKKFDALDKKLAKNEGVKSLRAILNANPFLIIKLSDLLSLKREFWISYLKVNDAIYNEFLSFYEGSKVELEKIVTQAKADESKWKDVVLQFKKRFHVPFSLKVSNQEDVVLKQQAPTLQFLFNDGSGKDVPIEKDSLLGLNSSSADGVLSTGEKRALYILNMIFEVEGRRIAKTPTLMVVDDIADSFDYRNKYAIIEYLKEIVSYKDFRVVILTHNFDFFRTCFSRIGLAHNSCFHVEKFSSGIKLVKTSYMKNVPLQIWQKSFHAPYERIAAIPFVRNLIEYTKQNFEQDKDFLLLTSLLHIKSNTPSINFGMLKSCFDTNLTLVNPINFQNDDAGIVLNEIFDSAEGIVQSTNEIASLEEKIVLSIACRLKSEQLMLAYLAKFNPAFDPKTITSHQTNVLYNECRNCLKVEDYPNLFDCISRVLLMTTENIHLNSFMYEPIIDLGSEHLKQLYKDLSAVMLPT